MPIHLSTQNRRQFLVRSAAASAGLLVFQAARGDDRAKPIDPDLFAILNDTHVSEMVDLAPNGQNISGNLRHVVRYLIELPKRPAAVFINGDLAHNRGLPGDYRQLATLLQPLADAGLDVHLTMGNHDARGPFYEALAAHRPAQPAVASHHTAIVCGAKANFFLLDSLTETNVVTGALGEEQRAWLAQALDAHADRPALVVVHHTPQFKPNGPEAKFTWSGLSDATALFEMLAARKHVKGYIHGHEHNWGLSRQGNLHVINTPAVGYVGKPGRSTTGWTMMRLGDRGATLTTYTIDGVHAWHNRTHEIAWHEA